MRTRTISKVYSSIHLAEAYYLYLCNHYESVRLVRSPIFTDSGIYTWEVR